MVLMYRIKGVCVVKVCVLFQYPAMFPSYIVQRTPWCLPGSKCGPPHPIYPGQWDATERVQFPQVLSGVAVKCE